jgi:hypothetical protein
MTFGRDKMASRLEVQPHGATSGAGTAYLYGAPEFSPGF